MRERQEEKEQRKDKVIELVERLAGNGGRELRFGEIRERRSLDKEAEREREE